MIKTGGLSSLTRGMRSMRRTGKPCYGMSGARGLVARILISTATATGPNWWYETQGKGQATSCTARRAQPRGTPSPLLKISSGSPPSSGSFGEPTLVLHNRGTHMKRGQGGSLNTSSRIFGTYRRGARQGATNQSRPKAFW